MRVALLSAEYPPQPGGVGDYTACLGEALAARGLDLHVITTRNPAAALAPGSLPRHEVSGWGWGCWGEVAALLRMLGPDLLHIQYQTGAYAMHPAINLLPRILRARGLHLPILVTCHDLRLPYLLPKADALRRWLTSRLLRDADMVIVTNAEDAARLQARLPGDRTIYAASSPLAPVVIPIGSNIAVVPLQPGQRDDWRRRMGAGPADRLLGYFGLTNRSKGVDLLLRALAQLEPGWHLAIIGGEAGTSDADNRRYAAELAGLEVTLGLGGRVWRSGQLDALEVSAALQACDYAVLPFRDGASYRRGSMLAALAHGLPLITTRPRVPLDPPLRHEVEALLLDADEARLPGQIAATAQRLAADPALALRLRDGARHCATAFSWPQIAERHLALYDDKMTR